MNLEEATAKVVKIAGYNPGRLNAKINFQFEDGMIHLDDTQSPAIINNTGSDAACTVIFTLEDFEKIIYGNMNPLMALLSGKMKVKGDKTVAMKLASFF